MHFSPWVDVPRPPRVGSSVFFHLSIPTVVILIHNRNSVSYKEACLLQEGPS